MKLSINCYFILCAHYCDCNGNRCAVKQYNNCYVYINTLNPPQSHVDKFEEVHSQIDQPQQALERTIAVYCQQHAVRMLSIPFPPVAWMHHEVGVFL